MLEVEITRLALAQMEESRAWYALEQENLGEEFVDAVAAAIEATQERPRQFPFYHRQVRRCVLHRFPFQNVLRHQADQDTHPACGACQP